MGVAEELVLEDDPWAELKALARAKSHSVVACRHFAYCKICASYAAKGWQRSNLVRKVCSGPTSQIGTHSRARRQGNKR